MENGLFWERLENEPETAYNAFCVYRDLGLTRSLRKAAAAFYAQQEGHQTDPEGAPNGAPNPAALRRFKEWSRRWMWVARAEAFDAEEARERSLRMRERRIKTAEFHWQLGQLALQRVAERLRTMPMDEPIPSKSLATLMRAALELQRAGLGEPGLVVDVRGTARPPEEDDEERARLAALSVEDQEELARIAGFLEEEDYLPDGEGETWDDDDLAGGGLQ